MKKAAFIATAFLAFALLTPAAHADVGSFNFKGFSFPGDSEETSSVENALKSAINEKCASLSDSDEVVVESVKANKVANTEMVGGQWERDPKCPIDEPCSNPYYVGGHQIVTGYTVVSFDFKLRRKGAGQSYEIAAFVHTEPTDEPYNEVVADLTSSSCRK